MTSPPLRDDPARKVIRRDLDRTLFVEAGAGSGKTGSLSAALFLSCSTAYRSGTWRR